MKRNKPTFLIFLVILLIITNLLSFALSYFLYCKYNKDLNDYKTSNNELSSDNEYLEDMVSDMRSVIYEAEETLGTDIDGDDKVGEQSDSEEEENCYHESSDGEFYVTSPCEDEVLDKVFNIAGRGRVFEASFNVRIKDADGNELYDGSHMTEGGYKDNLDAFSDTISWSRPTTRGSGTIEFYTNSAVDGSEVVMVAFSIKY